MLNAFSNASGICRGFSEHIKVGHYATAAEGRRALLKRLRKQGDSPLLMAMHWIDPHAPYTRGGAKGARGSDFDRFLLEVAYVDSELGKLLKQLDKPRFKDRTILIFASDHGEAFGEHGSSHHAGTMYEELLRVPLLIHGPGIEPRDIDEPVSLIDLGPTLLDLFGEPTPGWFMGESLVPFLIGEARDLTRPIAGEAGRRMQSMVFPDGYKAIVDLRRNTEEVYDLRVDPRELNNLAETSARADAALNDLRLFFATHQLENYDPPWRKF
jgi:arylsulfatase A-like enzyme